MELGKYIHFVGCVCAHLIPIHMYMYPHTHVLLADVMVCEGEVYFISQWLLWFTLITS